MKTCLSRVFVVASAFLFVLPSAFPEVAQASVDDQRREVERIVDELDRLHTQADILAEDYAEAEDRRRELDVEVAEAAQRVAAKEAELDTLRGDLSEVAVRSFTGAGGDVLGPLFSNADLYSESLQRDQFSRVALSVGTGTTDDLDEVVADLAAERANLESKRAEVAALTVTIEQKRQQTDELTAEFVERQAEAEQRLGVLIQEEEERRSAAAFAQLQADLAAQQAQAATGNGGGAQQAAPATGAGDGGSNDGGSNDGGSSDGGSSDAPAAAESASTPPPPPPPPSDVPVAAGLAQVAIDAAMSQIGVKYVYATSKPGVSFDCSGLTHYAWGQAGVYLPRNSRAQAAALPRVPAASAQPGDLLFYYSPISHVGVYLGNGQLVHAPNSGTTVKVASVSWGKVTAVGRPG